jgi:hypothetical protein
MAIWALGAAGFAITLAPGSAHATDSYIEAQAALANAYSDYYRELRSKPGFTEKQAKELADQVLSPASARVARTIEEDFKKNYVASSAAEPVSRGLASSSGSSNEKAAKETPVEEVAIDGSSVPAEVEFPGKPKQPQKSAVSPETSKGSDSHRPARPVAR